MPKSKKVQDQVEFGAETLKIEEIVAVAEGASRPILSNDSEFKLRISAAAEFLDRELRQQGHIYGVTTGYGDSVLSQVPVELIEELPLQLVRFHGCGLGDEFSEVCVRAILAVRIASLCSGYSGVRISLLESLIALLVNEITPVMPQEGSVGASGDLTPLSYVAAVLAGEREVKLQGNRMAAGEAFKQVGMKPVVLRPKEALAIMNGTSVMTALMCLAFVRAEYLCRLSSRVTSLASMAMFGNPAHFNERLFAAKPHPGQFRCAARINSDLSSLGVNYKSHRIQDRYSIRCAPHVIGVLEDFLPAYRSTLEIELNSANDNPLIDAAEEQILHGGHFYGGHVAFVADSMKVLVANIADLLDRQLALLVDVKYNNGLPPNLSGANQERASINHGLKAVQIGASAWAAEALKNCMPASVFSRSTECHNQDKVSMGTIAARDCMRVLQLTEQVTSALLVSVHQAIRIRLMRGELSTKQLGTGENSPGGFIEALGEDIPFISEDKPLENVLRKLVDKIQSRCWRIYDE